MANQDDDDPLLDSSVIIAWFRGDPSINDAMEALSSLKVPAVGLGELYGGAYRSHQPARNLRAIAELIRRSRIFSIDGETAEVYGQIRYQLETRGERLADNDLWIAATAIRHNLPLATRDRHFERVPGLALLAW